MLYTLNCDLTVADRRYPYFNLYGDSLSFTYYFSMHHVVLSGTVHNRCPPCMKAGWGIHIIEGIRERFTYVLNIDL